MNKFYEMVSNLEVEDIEDAQDRDFYMWLQYLAEYPQGLYDMLNTDPEWYNLTEFEVKERKAVLDAAFVYLQSAMEDISKVLKEKYPKEMAEPHNRINF